MKLAWSLLSLLACVTVFAQTSAPKGGGTSAPVGSPSLPKTTTPNNTPTSPNSTSGFGHTVFVTGKVMLEDGTAPPEEAIIERSCGSIRRAETRTDLKGHFSFQIGGPTPNESILDASSDASFSPVSGSINPGIGSNNTNTASSGSGRGGGMNSASLMGGCELKAVLPGYRSEGVNLLTEYGNIDVGTLILKRMGGRQGDTISMTNALAPKDAKKAYDKARQLVAKDNFADARKELTKAVESYPKYAAAWVELGRLQSRDKQTAEARQSFQKALDADARYLPPYDELSKLAFLEQNWKELIDTTSRLIQMDAYDYPQAYFLNAIANLNTSKSDAAEKSAREALKLDPRKFARAQYVLGLALAQKGEFAAAAEQMKGYLAGMGANSPEVESVRKRILEVERLATGSMASSSPRQQQ